MLNSRGKAEINWFVTDTVIDSTKQPGISEWGGLRCEMVVKQVLYIREKITSRDIGWGAVLILYIIKNKLKKKKITLAQWIITMYPSYWFFGRFRKYSCAPDWMPVQAWLETVERIKEVKPGGALVKNQSSTFCFPALGSLEEWRTNGSWNPGIVLNWQHQWNEVVSRYTCFAFAVFLLFELKNKKYVLKILFRSTLNKKRQKHLLVCWLSLDQPLTWMIHVHQLKCNAPQPDHYRL